VIWSCYLGCWPSAGFWFGARGVKCTRVWCLAWRWVGSWGLGFDGYVGFWLWIAGLGVLGIGAWIHGVGVQTSKLLV
jgi:hypothetical protein